MMPYADILGFEMGEYAARSLITKECSEARVLTEGMSLQFLVDWSNAVLQDFNIHMLYATF